MACPLPLPGLISTPAHRLPPNPLHMTRRGDELGKELRSSSAGLGRQSEARESDAGQGWGADAFAAAAGPTDPASQTHRAGTAGSPSVLSLLLGGGASGEVRLLVTALLVSTLLLLAGLLYLASGVWSIARSMQAIQAASSSSITCVGGYGTAADSGTAGVGPSGH